ncbi:hypothetical protein Tco_0572503 [Tanacetum coccineum]
MSYVVSFLLPLHLSESQSPSRTAVEMGTATDDNPLLKEFEFPPFDSIDASHVQPDMRTLLKKLALAAALVAVGADDKDTNVLAHLKITAAEGAEHLTVI